MKRKLSGFTLIELLVVMVILGLLATIGLASFRTARMKARDAQRKHDLAQIQRALEMYYNDNGRYRTSSEGLPSAGAAWQDPEVTSTLYMSTVPGDPRGGSYCYLSDTAGTYYKLYANLENTNDPAATLTASCDGVTYNYGVSSADVSP